MRLAPRCSRLRWQSFKRLTVDAELLALQEQRRKARQPGSNARVPDHQDASRDADINALNFKGNEGVVGLTWWIEKMEPVFNISGCAIENQEVLKKKMMDKYCPQGEIKKTRNRVVEPKANETEKVDKYISGLPDNIYGNVKSSKPKTLDETIELVNDLMDQKLRTYAERQTDNKRKADDSSRNNHGHQ
ncbi:hypothetical protein Tco_1107734 [Tanacetum coccineum]